MRDSGGKKVVVRKQPWFTQKTQATSFKNNGVTEENLSTENSSLKNVRRESEFVIVKRKAFAINCESLFRRYIETVFQKNADLGACFHPFFEIDKIYAVLHSSKLNSFAIFYHLLDEMLIRLWQI